MKEIHMGHQRNQADKISKITEGKKGGRDETMDR
jgi:hypothetical protein